MPCTLCLGIRDELDIPGAGCWLELAAAPEAGAPPDEAPRLEAMFIMLCIISGDMLAIIELAAFIISGEICMPSAIAPHIKCLDDGCEYLCLSQGQAV